VVLDQLHSIEEIDKVIEEKSGKKLVFSNRKRGFIDKVGNVFPIVSRDIDEQINARLRRRWWK
jgi:hypothetical protein